MIPNPAPVAATQAPDMVLLSSEARFHRGFTNWAYDERVRMRLLPLQIVLQGVQGQVVVPRDRVLGIQLARARWSGWYLFSGIVLLALAPVMFALRSPAFLFQIPMGLMFLLMYRNFLWVEIAFADPMGVPRRLYLADGGMLGWSGLLGGTRRLHDLLLTPPWPVPLRNA